jgi:hypothetical protein
MTVLVRRSLVTLLSLIAALALVLASAAEAKVSLVRLTSPVRPGAYATLTVQVSRSARCSITVTYKSGRSQAAGLYRKRSVSGRVSWSWKVGTRTTSGRWPITVSCGSVGTLRTSFVVKRKSSSGGGSGSSKCDPNYRGACVPIVPYDLDCADISGTVYVVGVDVHRFDGDGDGVGCE